MNKTIWIIGALILSLFMILSTYHYVSEDSKIIQVGYLPSNHQAALFTAKDLLMFEKENLDVELVPFDSGAELIDALKKDKIDIGYCGITPVTMAIDKGAPIKIVAPVNLEGSGIVVSKDSNITNAIDLENKTIGIPNNESVQNLLLHIYLENNKVNFNSIKYYKSIVPEMPLNLKEGLFDAYIAWDPFVSLSDNYGIGNVLTYSGDIWPNHPCCVVVTSEKFIQKKPDLLSRFIKIHVNATQFIKNNSPKTIEVLSKKMGTLSNVEKESLTHIEYIAIPDAQFDDNVMKMVYIQKELGFINHNLTYSQIFNLNYLPSN